MRTVTIAGGAVAIVLVLVGIDYGRRALMGDVDPNAATSSGAPSSTSPAPAKTHAAKEADPPTERDQGFLYGRITTIDGAIYEGRLRWGGDEEASWSDYFNGTKAKNLWAAQVPPERLPTERRAIKFLGVELGYRKHQIDLGRRFMARFGDIARIEAHGRDVRVTVKSGTAFHLDRFEAGDFDDRVRVWDRSRGVVDLDSLRISSIELLPTPALHDAPDRLHGTVRTRQGDFTGFVQWDRQECVGTDELDGRTADGERSLRFDTIRSIARQSGDSSLVTLLDGREIVLSHTNDVGRGNRGIYVDDPRYGRVLVAWDAFDRIDFSSGGGGPGYGDFPPGRPLSGTVTTRAGARLTGRLVYDLDESESIETLDAPIEDVNYSIPFGIVASIVPPGRDESVAQRGKVILHGGEELQLEPKGDLGDGNAGMLIFVEGRPSPEYVPWMDVEQIEFDAPPSEFPPPGGG